MVGLLSRAAANGRTSQYGYEVEIIMSPEFTNRIAVVGGAAQGIGRAVAHGLRDGGAAVHALDIDAPGVAKTASDLGISHASLDLSDRHAVARAIADIEHSSGPVDIGQAQVDFDRFELTTPTGVTSLTAREVGLLRALVERDGEVITRGELLENVWGLQPETRTRVVDTFDCCFR